MKRAFEVFSVDWLQSEPDIVFAVDAEDACEVWCQEQESQSNFVDGYPSGHELRIVDASGVETRHRVDTDWHATFHVSHPSPTQEDSNA